MSATACRTCGTRPRLRRYRICRVCYNHAQRVYWQQYRTTSCRVCGTRLALGERVWCQTCRVQVQAAREAMQYTGSNRVAHCGRWHAVTGLPLRLECCGWVLGEEEP